MPRYNGRNESTAYKRFQLLGTLVVAAVAVFEGLKDQEAVRGIWSWLQKEGPVVAGEKWEETKDFTQDQTRVVSEWWRREGPKCTTDIGVKTDDKGWNTRFNVECHNPQFKK